MAIYTVVTGLTAATFLLTGAYVYANNPKKAVYRRCLFFSASVAFWSLGYFITLLQIPNFTLNICSSRISHAIGAFIPITYLHFVWEILNEKKNKPLFVSGYLISAAMFFACLTPLVVKTLLPKMGIQYYPEWGWFYPIYASLYLIYPGYAQYKIAKRIKIERGTEKIRLTLFFYALAFAFGGGVSLFLLIFNIPFPPFFSVLIILYPPMMAYAILAYRFLDVEVIIKKTLVFAGLFGAFMLVVGGVTAVSQSFLGQYLKMGMVANSLVSVFFAMLFYEPVRKVLVNLTDKYLFQKKFNLTSIVAQAGEAIALVQSLKWLAKRIVAFLITKCRIKRAVIYTRSLGNEHFERGAMRGFERNEYPPSILSLDHPIVRNLMGNRRVIECQRLEDQIRKKKENDSGDLEKMVEILKSFKVEVIIPSFLRSRIGETGIGKEKDPRDIDLRNILVLGGKKSDEPYLEEEMQVFYGLAQESAIAIENARLYDEAVRRSRELATMNKELNNTNAKLKVTQASLIVAEKNATMVGMAKAIGHEINNPLATVGGRATWISRDDLPACREIIAQNKVAIPESVIEKLEKNFSKIDDNSKRIVKSSKRIEVVVKTLTDILKDTKGEKGPLSLLVLCKEAREATRFLTYEENLSGCEIVENIAANVVILGNLEQLLQVFVNMIKNAYEAMAGQRDRQIEIKGDVDHDNPQMARIEFIDNGPGIPEGILPKIWGQGFSTKVMQENHIGAAGQGQGLFICKHVIESIHNGKIFVESTLGQGTKFVIKLPLADWEG